MPRLEEHGPTGEVIPPAIAWFDVPEGDVEGIRDMEKAYRIGETTFDQDFDTVKAGAKKAEEHWDGWDADAAQSALRGLVGWYANSRRAYQLIWTTLGRFADELEGYQDTVRGYQQEAEALNRARQRLISLVTAAGGSPSAVPEHLRPDVLNWIWEEQRVVVGVAEAQNLAYLATERTARDLTLARSMTAKWRRRMLKHRLMVANHKSDSNPLLALLAPMTRPGLTPAMLAGDAAAAGLVASVALLGGELVIAGSLLTSDQRQPQPLTDDIDFDRLLTAEVWGEADDRLLNTEGQNVETDPEHQPQPAGGGAGIGPKDPCVDKPAWLQNLMKGNEFDRLNEIDYSANEVVVAIDGVRYRVDSLKIYDHWGNLLPPGQQEIVSRKFTQLSDSSYRSIEALREINTKYAPGTQLVPGSPARTGITELSGQKVLEVPPQREGVPEDVLAYARMHNIIIRDTNGMVYRSTDDKSTDTSDPLGGYCK